MGKYGANELNQRTYTILAILDFKDYKDEQTKTHSIKRNDRDVAYRYRNSIVQIFSELYEGEFENTDLVTINFICRLVEDIKIDENLIKTLLNLNANFHMGSFGITDDNAICY